jgi:RNA polymerase sigma-70 factor (ECF subfamily)
MSGKEEISTFKNDEKALIKQILNGSNDAFKKLINENKRLAGSIVYKMISNSEDREDVLQDIFVKVYTNLSGFKFESKLSTWIAKISYTTCLNHLKKKKAELLDDINSGGEDEDSISETEKIQDEEVQLPDEIFSEGARKNVLMEEINTLPVLWKTIVTLYHSGEMNYEEISKITGLPIGTVKSYLFRGRKLLKEKLLNKFAKEDLL